MARYDADFSMRDVAARWRKYTLRQPPIIPPMGRARLKFIQRKLPSFTWRNTMRPIPPWRIAMGRVRWLRMVPSWNRQYGRLRNLRKE